MTTISRSDLSQASALDFSDFVRHFLSRTAMKRRLIGRGSFRTNGMRDSDQLLSYLEPVRCQLASLYSGKSPRVSVVLPAFNEEVELIPTLISYGLCKVNPGEVELIVVDNNSSDRTSEIAEACGARVIFCETKGVAHARSAGYSARSDSVEYIFFSDADARTTPPLRDTETSLPTSTILRQCIDYLDGNDNVIGISTGGVCEGGHWLYEFARRYFVSRRRSSLLSCWSGCNQFVRVSALEAIGGVCTSVDWDEDHHRHYELARLGKSLRMNLESANSNSELINPVYFSGRRFATVSLLIQHYLETKRRPKLERDEYGFPIHAAKVGWRDVR